MLGRLILQQLFGYIRIRVEGRHLERFINLATVEGVVLWNINRSRGVLVAQMWARHFKRLRPIVRKTRCRVRIEKKMGFPFTLHRARNRQILVVGLVILAIALYVFSNFIWFIEVVGLENLAEGRVIAELIDLGLKPGCSKPGIDTDMIEEELALRFKEVSWAGITISGTKATVEIVEKTLPPDVVDPNTPGHLVASKRGLITTLIALQGTPVVKEGAMVEEGQLLIEGLSLQQQPGEDPETGEPLPPLASPVQARGIARARVWYSEESFVPLTIPYQQVTGETYTRVLLRIGGSEVILVGAGEVPFALYQQDEEAKPISLWRNDKPIVEIIMTTFRELKEAEEALTLDEAEIRARDFVQSAVYSRLPEGVEVLGKESEVLQRDSKGVRVRLTIETLEDIARLEVTEAGP